VWRANAAGLDRPVRSGAADLTEVFSVIPYKFDAFLDHGYVLPKPEADVGKLLNHIRVPKRIPFMSS